MTAKIWLKWPLRILVLVALLAMSLWAWTWSWTFTDEGRMEYGAAIIAKLVEWQAPGELIMTPEARKIANDNTVKWLGDRKVYPVASVRDLEVAGPAGPISIRVYVPEAEGPLPLYLMVHGGGYWMGNDYRIEEAGATQIANLANVIVVTVDYRLAPEHPFPAALNDCYAVLQWLALNGADLGGDPTRIAVGGASAGGNLSAALTLKARDEMGPALAFQLLIVPSTDMSNSNDRETGSNVGLILKANHMRKMLDAYTPDPTMRLSPYASPLLAEDHSGLPPAYIITAQFDPLRDQGEALGEKLAAAGVPTTVRRYPGVLHGFLGTPDIFSEAITEAAAEMKRTLHNSSSL